MPPAPGVDYHNRTRLKKSMSTINNYDVPFLPAPPPFVFPTLSEATQRTVLPVPTTVEMIPLVDTRRTLPPWNSAT